MAQFKNRIGRGLCLAFFACNTNAADLYERVQDLEVRVDHIDVWIESATGVLERFEKNVTVNSVNTPLLQGNKHIVRDGESLRSIADLYAIPVEVLWQLNPGIQPTRLKIGQSIFVRSNFPAPSSYIVESGDTFNQIVLSFQLDPAEVRKLNPKLDPNKLKKDDKLILRRELSSDPPVVADLGKPVKGSAKED